MPRRLLLNQTSYRDVCGQPVSHKEIWVNSISTFTTFLKVSPKLVEANGQGP